MWGFDHKASLVRELNQMETNYQENILTLIAKNLNGIADLEEVFQLNVWLESSDENRKYYEQVKNIWDVSDNRMDYADIDESNKLRSGRI